MRKLNIFENYKNFHFIGAGGISMSGLAEILHDDGCFVTGSDRNNSGLVEGLRKKGIDIKIGHDAQNVGENVQVVVYNAAVPQDNPEMLEAKARGLYLMDRAELLGRLMQNYETAICVAGTHGKTTTTSMLAEIFMTAQKDPTVMNGGILPSMGGAMRIGSRDFIISEACEYHNSFLKFWPHVGIILNIEMDHSDYFDNIQTLRASFKQFAQKIPRDGLLVVNGAIEAVEQLTQDIDCNICIFGEKGHFTASNIRYNNLGYPEFDVVAADGEKTLGSIVLKIPGHHNVQNAMAAICAALHCGINFNAIATALSHFTGPMRRFQHLGNYNGATIVDDYAHHPTEVAATIQAAKNMPHNRLWAVFQPHTRARTAQFLNEFAQELARADEIIILDIYNPAGREEEKYPIHAKDIVAKIDTATCRHLPNFATCVDFLRRHIKANDLVLVMGAGDVHKVAESLANMP
ncbi:MAG: UDP-N-acetylmuramate--L-alanine ligase [Defluviitaleaceae bacterium]|nr:UDP-N-acetylmuramate--L-alanine ligase [Defluviitaleaceae bacterium]